MNRQSLAFVWLALTTLLACSSGESGVGAFGSAPFGAPCAKTEDCASGLCVRVDDGGGVCTRACLDDSGCPQSSNWGCVQPDDYDGQVCGCVPDASAETCGDGVDNECNGLVDDCQLCDGKPVPKDDPDNCGECGKQCRGDQICTLGECTCPPTEAFECGGKCTNVEINPQHCGQCGTECAPGQSCQNGACVCAHAVFDDYCAGSGCVDFDSDAQHCGGCDQKCEPGQVCEGGACTCPGDTKPDHCVSDGCVNLATDPSHCGTCDNACPAAQVCVAGACECPSALQPDHCAGAGCVHLGSDTNHCGACGNACPALAACSNGQCTCPTTQPTVCGATCTNTNTDPQNCGSCGNACPSGQVCKSGACGCPTAKPNVCGSTCVDLSADSQNCGSCGTACPAGKACANGGCNCPIAAPNICNGVCVSLASDSQNCGSCGNVCPSGQSCQSGACQCPISGQAYCDGQCVSVSNNPSHCGACNNVCPSGQTCSAGSCKCSTSGHTACGSNCVNLSTDPANCGSCGNFCPSGQTCSTGTCKCPSGQTWCPQLAACINLSTSFDNCGTCGNVCNAGQVCSFGACTCPTSGQAWCASTGACTSIVSNPSHCGTCDKVCPSGTFCQTSTCKCNQTGFTLCGGTSCYDLQNDPEHCGSCTTACPGSMACAAGKCVCPAPIASVEARLTNTATETLSPSMAWNGTHVGLVYLEGTTASVGDLDVYFALLNPDGTRAKSPDVALTNYGSQNTVKRAPDITWNGSEFAVVWPQRTGIYESDHYLLRLAPDGTAKGTAVNFSANTAGTTLGDGAPRILWSPTYGGYLVATQEGAWNHLQRIGTDGTAPEAVNASNTGGGYPPMGFALAPSGEAAIATDGALVFFNADGSQTKPIAYLAPNSPFTFVGPTNTVHDGATWLTAWYQESSGIFVNRGETQNSPYLAASFTPPTSNEIAKVALVPSGTGAIEMLWGQDDQINLRRFLLPAGSTSTLIPLTSTLNVLPTATSNEQLSAVHTGSGSMLVVWGDTRWGPPELHTRSFDFGSCP